MTEQDQAPRTAEPAATAQSPTRITSVSDLIDGGMVLPITRWSEPVMHHRTTPVTRYDDELHTLIKNMFATMEAADGVGLAAPQVGVDLALFVYDCPDEDRRRHIGVFCNPVVSLPEGDQRKLAYLDEGCLSLPGAYMELARPDFATCRGQDAFGNDITVEGHDYFARCLQHETDHLNGTVFGDRLAARARKKLYAQHRDVADRYPADWPASPKLDD